MYHHISFPHLFGQFILGSRFIITSEMPVRILQNIGKNNSHGKMQHFHIVHCYNMVS